MGRAGMSNLCCQLPAVCLAVAVPWWHSVDVIPFFPTAGPAQARMTPAQSCREEPACMRSRGLTVLSEAREPWPGSCVCHCHGVSLLCLALTLGPSVGPGSPSAVWNSWDAGMSVCECCPLCPSDHGEGFGRGWLHPHWAPFPAGSLPLPPSPTDSSYSRGNDSGAM